jgi:hypothetical protein
MWRSWPKLSPLPDLDSGPRATDLTPPGGLPGPSRIDRIRRAVGLRTPDPLLDGFRRDAQERDEEAAWPEKETVPVRNQGFFITLLEVRPETSPAGPLWDKGCVSGPHWAIRSRGTALSEAL